MSDLQVTPNTHADDAAYLAALRSGDDTAYELLVRQHGARLIAVARRLLQNDEDARDAVQDAFLSAFKSLHQFDGQCSLSTWLHRISVNSALMKLRSRKRRPEQNIDDLLPQFVADGHAAEPATAWDQTADSLAEQRELRKVVRENIERLPELYRTVLLLRDIEELSTDETARLLGVTLTAVNTRLHRARQALRTRLDAHFRGHEPC